MIHFEPIPVERLPKYIDLAFRGDELLLKNLHVCPGSLHDCVYHTYHSIVDWRSDYSLKIYKVQLFMLDGDNRQSCNDIGFLVVMHHPYNVLLSFGLNIQYRTKEIKSEWLEKVTSLFTPVKGIPFVVTLHQKNERAINFFIRNGFSSKFNPADKTVSLCQ